ncbi:hypothetical protein C1646_771403, partial [Rhizophagus diaphanus]
VTSDQIFTFNFKPESGQTHAKFEVYYTNEESATYIDEPGMKLLGVLNVDLPDAHLDNRSINFGLTFGPNKITAFTRNELNGQKFRTCKDYKTNNHQYNNNSNNGTRALENENIES